MARGTTDPGVPGGGGGALTRGAGIGAGNTREERAARRMLRDGVALRASDPDLFASVLRQLLQLEQGGFATARGHEPSYHPLASVLGARKDDPVFDAFLENARELREAAPDEEESA